MRSIMKYSVAPIFACLYLLLATQAARGQGASIPVMASVSLEKNPITQREPAILELTFENQSDQEVVISLGYEDEKMEIMVVDPEGRTFRKPRPALREGFRSTDAFYVAGGKTAAGHVALNDWFVFEKIGTYQIEVNLSSRSSPKERFSYEIRGKPSSLALIVLPRDEHSLKSACADLLARAQDLHSSSEALTAAKALSKVDDPIAVPFLVEAMKGDEFKGLMIDALARLKTDQAIQALLSASRSSDPETRNLAHSALVSLGVAKD
jgi:hypothetical protein